MISGVPDTHWALNSNLNTRRERKREREQTRNCNNKKKIVKNNTKKTKTKKLEKKTWIIINKEQEEDTKKKNRRNSNNNRKQQLKWRQKKHFSVSQLFTLSSYPPSAPSQTPLLLHLHSHWIWNFCNQRMLYSRTKTKSCWHRWIDGRMDGRWLDRQTERERDRQTLKACQF